MLSWRACNNAYPMRLCGLDQVKVALQHKQWDIGVGSGFIRVDEVTELRIERAVKVQRSSLQHLAIWSRAKHYFSGVG